MKKIALALFALALSVPAFAQSNLPCSNIYINNDTVIADVVPVADQIVVAEIIKGLQQREGFCYKGYVNSSVTWQAQKHGKTDVLLSFTVGPLDDGNGVGAVGKKIEIVAYSVCAYNHRVNTTVCYGGMVTWFAISGDDRITRFRAYNITANNIVYAVGIFAAGGVVYK